MSAVLTAHRGELIKEFLKGLSIRPPCICHHLHHSCSPSTCREAAKRKLQETQLQGKPPEESSSPSNKNLLMESTLKNIKQAALSGCLTCGILYAGLNAPLDAGTSWMVDVEEKDLLVVIRGSTEFVHVYSRSINGSDSKYSAFTFYASSESILTNSCNAFSQSVTLSYGTASQESLNTAAKWITECISSHKACAISEAPPLPTRVIDLRPPDDTVFQPCLFESKEKNENYVALSHCGGNLDILKTTKETLHSRKAGIDISSLSQLMREAIYITRGLQIRYLWIDSLCIIQDDEADWQSESAKMALIYEHALFTISAEAAVGGEGSLFHITEYFHNARSWEVIVEYGESNDDSEGGCSSHLSRGQSIRAYHGVAEPLSLASSSKSEKYLENPGENIGTGEGSDSWEDMNSEKDMDDGEYVESDGIIKHYHPSKSYIETISPNFLENAVCGGYCMASIHPSANGPIILEYVLGTYSRANFPEDASFPVRPSGIFVRKLKRLSHRRFSDSFHVLNPSNHLASRAWAYQERLLSTRILHYTKQELVWECNTAARCQCNTITDPTVESFLKDYEEERRANSDETARTLKVSFQQKISPNHTPDQLINAWMDIVFHYSHLELSHSSDQLPALSGLAKRFQQDGRLGTYKAGLWGLYLPRLLSWKPMSPKVLQRPATSPGPTWSWASLIGGIYFPSRFTQDQSQSIVGRVIDSYCTLAGLDPTGSVSEGRLVVSGRVAQARLRIYLKEATRGDDDSLDEVQEYTYQIIHGASQAGVSFFPDSLSHIDVPMEEQNVTCLLWSIGDGPFYDGRDRESLATCSIVLRSVPDIPNTYVRIGLLLLWEYEKNQEDRGPKNLSWQEWYQDSEERQLVIL